MHSYVQFNNLMHPLCISLLYKCRHLVDAALMHLHFLQKHKTCQHFDALLMHLSFCKCRHIVDAAIMHPPFLQMQRTFRCISYASLFSVSTEFCRLTIDTAKRLSAVFSIKHLHAFQNTYVFILYLLRVISIDIDTRIKYGGDDYVLDFIQTYSTGPSILHLL